MDFKIITLLLILLPSAIYAQNLTVNEQQLAEKRIQWKPLETLNAEVEVDEVDVNTNSRIRSTRIWTNFGDHRIIGMVKRIDDFYGFQFFVPGVGCFSEISSKVVVVLENNEEIELSQVSESNCESVAGAEFVAIKRDLMHSPDKGAVIRSNLNKLISYNWQSMRIYGLSGYIDIVPKTKKKINGAQFFREHLQALGYEPHEL